MKSRGLMQALGVAAYCSAVGAFMFNIGKIVGDNESYFGPVSFLLLFSVSALTCALIVFYKPYLLFFSNKKKQAIDLVVATTAWLFLFFLIAVSLAIFLK